MMNLRLWEMLYTLGLQYYLLSAKLYKPDARQVYQRLEPRSLS